MNAPRLKGTATTVVLLALTGVIVWQHFRGKRPGADADALRQRLAEADTLREENQRLTEQLRAASERSQTDMSTLARLRGQSARMRQLEQENAQLKTERNRLAWQPTESKPAVSDDQTPEWPVAQVRMRFCKVLGLSIHSFANNNQGQMPSNVLAAISAPTERQLAQMMADQVSDAGAHDLRIDQFELVFHGNLDATGREPGTILIARTKEPIQLSNGRWARPCVLDDGGGLVLVADTLDELAAKEKKLMHAQSP